jgi:sugar lactone lactonase YvrE
MRQRLVLSLSAACLAAGVTTAAAADGGSKGAGAKPSTYVIPGERVFPEGIAREPGSKAFFVTSTTDGTIFRGTLDQPQLAPYAAPSGERTTAVGLKADGRGNLVVAGGATGKVFVLDTEDPARQQVLDTKPAGASFVNDVAISKGYAYVTDSQQPFLYRVRLGEDGATGPLEKFVGFAGTPFAYVAGFNANGIAIDGGGRYAIVVQSATGKLFRVDLRTRAVREVDLGGGTVPAGDGLLLEGNVLYVARNAAELIVPVTLRDKGTRGTVGTGVTGPQLKYTTTIALDGKRLLAVNAQFDKRTAGAAPVLPFDVATIAVPKAPKAAKGGKTGRR